MSSITITDFIASLNKNKQQYENMTVVQLKQLSRQRKLPIYKTKSKLIQRLLMTDNTFEIPNEHPTYVPQLLFAFHGNIWHVVHMEKNRPNDELCWQVVKPEKLEEYNSKWKSNKDEKIKRLIENHLSSKIE